MICFIFVSWPLDAVEPNTEIEPVKSPNDSRQYRYLEFPNQLKVLLISDPASEKAAAAMDVHVGSAADPLSHQGLAHFLEHMLFLGTESYPDPADYDRFINQFGGNSNAYTSLEHTNYFVDIEAEHLDPLLDRFSEFFKAPLLDAAYVERERHAVHSEYQSRLKDEYWRSMDVLSQLVSADHPLAKFSIGNLDTLSNPATENVEEASAAIEQQDGGLRENGQPLQKALRDFFSAHYRPNNMALVVLGRESLDELQLIVASHFGTLGSDVRTQTIEASEEATQLNASLENGNEEPAEEPSQKLAQSEDDSGLSADSNNTDLNKKKSGPSMFEPRVLPAVVHIAPEQNLRELTLLFPLPSVDPFFRTKPLHYFGHLLGHEGDGSLLSVLKARGWAEALSAGEFLRTRHDALFSISITLTEAGLRRRDNVISLVFAAIEKIENDGIEGWRFGELQSLNDLAFRFAEPQEVIDTVADLASNLHDYPPPLILQGPYLMDEYDERRLRDFASFLNPENVLVMLKAEGLPTTAHSPFFHAPFSVGDFSLPERPLPPELRNALSLPAVNDFIPDQFAIKPLSFGQRASTKPELLKNAARIRVWFQQDRLFNVPKAVILLRVKSPEVASSLQGAALAHLFVENLNDLLAEYTYPAAIAGLDYQLSVHGRGLDLMMSGYDDGMERLLERIVDELRTPRFARGRFTSLQQALVRRLENREKAPPYVQLVDALPAALTTPSWTDAEIAQAVAEKTFDDLQLFAKRLFADSRADLLVYGNVTRQETAKLAGLIEIELLNTMGEQVLPPVEVVKLEPKAQALFSMTVDHPDNAVLLYLQGAEDGVPEQAFMMLLEQILATEFFYKLRTEAQLGYVVYASFTKFKNVPALSFIVQSPSGGQQALMTAIDNFLEEFSLPEDFEIHKQALIDSLLEQPKNVDEQAWRFWENITAERPDFELRQQWAKALSAISKESFAARYQAIVIDEARKLWLVAGSEAFKEGGNSDVNFGHREKEDGDPQTFSRAHLQFISDWPSFRAKQKIYSYP